MKSEWKKTTVEDVCLVVTDGSHFSPNSIPEGRYMVSVKDFTDYGFDFGNCKRISEDDYQKLKRSGCVPKRNDILIGKDGARYFEDVIIYRQNEEPALLSSIAILRANEKLILPEYLYYMMKNPVFKQDVRENYGSGSAIPRIILKDFKRMPLSIPPIPIQHRISSLLSVVDAKIAINQQINDNLAA